MRLLYKTGPMESLRKWFYKPKASKENESSTEGGQDVVDVPTPRLMENIPLPATALPDLPPHVNNGHELTDPVRDDRSLLAQFFFADDALNMVAAELDSFDGRKDPDRCSTLVNQLRHAQDRVLNITSQIMDQLLGDERVARGFRVKFPEDVLQDNLAGQLWFGAECLAAGSSILNRHEESVAMRPLAKALTRSLETVRSLLREQCMRPRALALQQHDDMLHESLRIFDRLFAEFELCYVSAMVNVKTPHEFEAQQLICVLFSESLSRALKQGLLTQEQVDSYDPALMFAVPRLAIVSGLLIYSSGPLSIDKMPEEMSDMFRPFRTLLHKIRSLLWTLDRRELLTLERLLCTNEDISNLSNLDLPRLDESNETTYQYPDIGEFVSRFYADHAQCKDLYLTQQSSSDQIITEEDYLPDYIEVMTPLIDGMRRLSNDIEETIPTSNMTESLETLEEEHSTPLFQIPETEDTDTFQNNEPIEQVDRTRKISKSETNDLSSLRNLSTNGLMMFDPLVINAVSQSSTSAEANRLLPDQNLVTSLNEQVTEIADRLSSIATNDAETNLEHNQIHSFSTNDVVTLISAETTGFVGPRNEQLSSMPSTSHGYLIPNAISQEPVVLASLSQNNSAVFNTEEENNDGTMLNNDLALMIPDDIETEIVTTNVTLANANLSSLLLTNEEFRQSFLETSEAEPEAAAQNDNEGVKFMLGYESDHDSPGDSGVSTENTSLDRSPDVDHKDGTQHYMQQNRVLKSPSNDASKEDDTKNTLENSFSETINNVQNGDITVNINYVDDSDSQKNEACSSSQCDGDVNIDKENCDSNSKDKAREEALKKELEERRVTLEQWGVGGTLDEYKSLEEVITEMRRQRALENKGPVMIGNSTTPFGGFNNPHSSTSHLAPRRSRVRKANLKNKKKKKIEWSPSNVILKLSLDPMFNESAQCADDEQIALALQAQELAARQQARSKFKSSEDLIHRLFVCIAGVADQLQTNFAADLRNILKAVFMMNQTPDKPETPPPEELADAEHEKRETIEYTGTEDQVMQNGGSFDSVYSAEEAYADSSNSDTSNSDTGNGMVRRNTANADIARDGEVATDRRKSAENVNLQASVSTGDLTEYRNAAEQRTVAGVERAPEWVPDIAAPDCMRCSAHFTAFRRRHHCRNCGKVFCASCSSNSIPLPRFGQLKPVRVCEECFQAIAHGCRRTATTQQHR